MRRSAFERQMRRMWAKQSLWGMRRRRRRIVLSVVAVAVILVLTLGTIIIAGAEGSSWTMWVICRPDGEVNARLRPTTHSERIGYLFLGDAVRVDRISGSWAHCTGLSFEDGSGWISLDYLADDPVTGVDSDYQVAASGRVAAWKGATASRRSSWVRPGEVVHVCAMSAGWALTDRGYIRTMYLRPVN